jgi:molybdopterin molybdotransferase
VLAEDVYASCHVPPQDNSAMDGFALRCADWQQGKALPLSQKIFAGAAPLVLLEGTAARLFTGSVVPEGADAVVLQEDCEFNDAHVVINEMPVTGQHIRRAGEDIQKGQLLLSKGVRLAAKHIGYLVAAGVTYVNVYEALKVGLLATGDEICEPGTQLAIGQIYNSNLYMLKAELEQLGCVVQAIFERDDVDKISDAFLVLCSENDVVLSIGGVSVGDADFVKQAISRRGSLSMWKVAMKPGKPLSFGCMLDKPVMGLPGNPVSAFATFHLFAKPFLQTMQGLQQACSESMFYPLHLDRALQPKREEFLRVRKVLLNGEWWLMPFQHQGSGVLSSVVWASGFARVPMNALTQHGDQVVYWEF